MIQKFNLYQEKHNNSGVTLVEVVVSILIIGIVFLPFISSFQNIAKGLIFSKARTLAANLAQEGMQIKKQQLYYRILVTTSPVYMTEFTPPVPYDPGNNPPEKILEGGIYFERSYYIQKVQEVNGELTFLPPTADDTGMKHITVNVTWYEGGKKRIVQLRSVVSNPDISALPGQVYGTVRDAQTFLPVNGAQVLIAENYGWQDITDSDGKYSISLYPGNYILVVFKPGYFPDSRQISVGVNPQQQNFDLQPRATGKITGDVWINDHIVISQIVASTMSLTGFEQEYLELYNPTTSYWIMAHFDGVSTIPVTGVKYQGPFDTEPSSVPIQYFTLVIPPSSYYLIANTATITVFGMNIPADAIFLVDNVIKCRDDTTREGAGAIGIYNISDGTWIDKVGWNGGVGDADWKQAPFYEGSPISQNIGFQRGEQYVRRSYIYGGNSYSNHLGISTWIARCYDSDNNDGSWNNTGNYWRNGDFADINPLRYRPCNSNISQPKIAGKPATGSIVTCTDDLSGGTVAYELSFTTQAPKAYFELTPVATGVWTVYISSKGYYTEIANTNVSAGSVVGIPNSSTDPQWIVPGINSVFLDKVAIGGTLTGTVQNALLQPLNNIKVTAGGSTVYTNSSGRYFFVDILSGVYTVIANPGNYNPIYSSEVRENIEVELGEVTSGIDFILVQCGNVKGFVTRDRVNPLQGVVMVAEHKDSGVIKGEAISDVNGIFVIPNLSTGTYYIKPILSSRESSVPEKSTVTVSVGVTVHAGTFTITGAFGKITGKVYYSNQPIKTGVLLLATTRQLSAPNYTPPVLSKDTLTGAAYYLTSSYEDGNYVLEVIGSTTTRYNIYAYYTTYTPAGSAVIQPKVISNILVPPGTTVLDQDFYW